VGADVSVDGAAAIDLLSSPELLRASTRPTANIAAITPMTVSIANQKGFLILVFNAAITPMTVRIANPKDVLILVFNYSYRLTVSIRKPFLSRNLAMLA
jgi:hypothetical protein